MKKSFVVTFCLFLLTIGQESNGQTYVCDYSNQCHYLPETDWQCQDKTPVYCTIVLNGNKTLLTVYSGNNSRTYSITSKEYYSDKKVWDFTVTNNSNNKQLIAKIDLSTNSILFQDNNMLNAYHISEIK